MATVSKLANAHTAISTGYTDPAYAYAEGEGYWATAVPGKNSNISAYWGFPAFSTGDIPEGAAINSVTAEIGWHAGSQASIITQYLQLFLGTSALGSEQSDAAEPTSDVVMSHQVTSGITLADLRTADYVRARTRSARGNTSTIETVFIEYVKLAVDYTAGTAHVKDLADAAVSGDSLDPQLEISRSFSDSASASEGQNRESAFSKSVADSITSQENRSGEAAFERQIADLIAPSQAAAQAAAYQKEVADQVAAGDASFTELAKLLTNDLADAISTGGTLAASQVFEKSLQDTASAGDASQTTAIFAREIDDALTTSEIPGTEAGLSREIGDGVISADTQATQYVIHKGLADSASAMDQPTALNSNSMSGKVAALATRVGQECRTIHQFLDGKFTITAYLAELDTEQKKYDARQNLDINIIDGGTFN